MYIKIKCILSRCIGCAGLLLLWPIFIILAIAIKLDSPGSVFFKQKRLGLHGKPFYMYKFRSMCEGAEHTGTGVYSGKGDSRVTKVGRILRATSLDELPQLINLANGTMHLISCRPPLTYHPWPISDYTQEQLHMFDLRPGITGWAQVNSRVSSKVQKKFINSQRSCLSVGFSHFYGCFRHRTPFFSNIMLWICP